MCQKETKIILNGSAKRSNTNAKRCTIYKHYSKQKSKKSYYLNLADKYENYIKKTSDVMKEIIRKSKFKIKKLPHRIVIDKKEKHFSKLFDMVN